jgi:methionyl-tRNA formyltransferase
MAEFGRIGKIDWSGDEARRRVLFLGYDRSETKLIDQVSDLGIEVMHSDEPLESLEDFDLVVSFGYRHLIPSAVIDNSCCPLVNLHISLLPWNKGAHPIFWTFFDNTPAGVTIHEIERGLDTGPIVAQREVTVELDGLTFRHLHSQMIKEVEKLFMQVFDSMILGTYLSRPQLGTGSYHKAADLPVEFSGWDSVIKDEINRLKGLSPSVS